MISRQLDDAVTERLKQERRERQAPAPETQAEAAQMKVHIVLNDKGNPPGKVAEAELHFTEGPLAGLKLIGFAVWERRGGQGRNVTFPARQYSVNGERHTFALLRPFEGAQEASNRIRDLILQACEAHEAQEAPRA